MTDTGYLYEYFLANSADSEDESDEESSQQEAKTK